MKDIKSNKGVTLISLMLYVVLTLIILSIVGAITTYFRSNINHLDVQTSGSKEFDKINLQLLNDTKIFDNTATVSDDGTKLIFKNGNIYDFKSNAIFLRDIKVAENIDNCKFDVTTSGNKQKLILTITIKGNQRITEYLTEIKIDNEKPKISVSNNNKYEKVQTATITIEDSTGLAAGAYNIKYKWTRSADEPTSWDDAQSTTITVEAGDKAKTTTLTKDNDAGIYYLHVKAENLKNLKGNTSSPVAFGIFCLDNRSLIIGANINYHEYIGEDGNALSTMPSYKSTEAKNGYTDTTFTVKEPTGSETPMQWIVLGEENGQIKITTKNIVQPTSGGETYNGFKYLNFRGKAGYTNFVDELNKISAIYGKGKYADTNKFQGGTSGGRSFKTEDFSNISLIRTAGYKYALEDHGDGYLIYNYDPDAIPDGKSTEGGLYSKFEYMELDASNSTKEEYGWNTLDVEDNTSVTIYVYDRSDGIYTLPDEVGRADEDYWLAEREVSVDIGAVHYGAWYIMPYGTTYGAVASRFVRLLW